LGQILALNLSHNRLESICGLERLMALERVDLRHNILDESGEVGRLATLPHISEVWVEGNPFVEYEDGYRITCFNFFWKEGKFVTLDGSPPGFYEKRNLASPPPRQTSSLRPISIPQSPPVVPVMSPVRQSPVLEGQSAGSGPEDGTKGPALVGAVPPGKGKKKKRIVDLDGGVDGEGGTQKSRLGHVKAHSESLNKETIGAMRRQATLGVTDPITAPSRPEPTKMGLTPNLTRIKHSRYQSELIPASSGALTSTSPPIRTLSPSPPIPPAVHDSAEESPVPCSPPRGRHTIRPPQSVSSRSAAKHVRGITSVFERPDAGAGNGEVEEYRKRIEALRSDMGDAWLKVFSQSQSDGVPG
jgi:hypothetical protein